jgi:hypothetical protein
MQRSLVLALLLGVAGAAAAAGAAPGGGGLARAPLRPLRAGDDAPPRFPDAYEMEWDFSMPYFDLLQPQGFK